jgi:general secretion pathway protein A
MSYCDFYKLKEVPFANMPDLRYFFDQPPYNEAISRVTSAIDNEKKLTIVVGNCGVGKTIISRRILNIFENSNKYEPNLMVCLHSDMAAGWFLQKLAIQLRLDGTIENRYRLFEDVSNKLAEIGRKKHNIIMIDEANRIQKPEVFEEIRGLIDVMSETNIKFSLVLFGLPNLEKQLALDEALQHRIESRIILKQLPSTKATREYVLYRLKVAGSKERIFDEAAYPIIYIATHGNPRLVNIVCDNAMTEGYLTRQEIITEKEVERVVVEMGYNTRLKSLFLDADSGTIDANPLNSSDLPVEPPKA